MMKINENECIGCGACQTTCRLNCISMEQIDGQYLPVINKQKCVDCGQCEEVCVAQNIEKLKFNKTISEYYGFAENEAERLASSSGGVFYAIAKKFIDDGGVVVGASFNSVMNVQHVIIDKKEDLSRIQGSKYVESELYSVFTDVKLFLLSGKKVLFSGVPCQIGAIKKYLKQDYDNLYTCEVFCHGAPRSGIFDSYLKWIQEKKGRVIGFNFRSKKKGWDNPAYDIDTEHGNLFQLHKNNIYHLMFGKHVSLRDSCFNCQFRKRDRISDLSLGDFWGIEKYYPEVQRKNGVSAIIVNTEKGHSLLKESKLFLRKCDINEIFEKNRWMIQNYDRPLEQEKFIQDFSSLSTRKFFEKYVIQYKYIDKVKRIIERLL